jgi:hypothetical protein
VRLDAGEQHDFLLSVEPSASAFAHFASLSARSFDSVVLITWTADPLSVRPLLRARLQEITLLGIRLLSASGLVARAANQGLHCYRCM